MTTTITTDSDAIIVRLGVLDRIAALRGDVRLPLGDIKAVTHVADGLEAVRGIRAPGLGVPGARKIGTWRRRGSATVAIVRGHGPAVEITMRRGPVQRVIVSDPDAAASVAALRAAVSRSAR